MNGELKMTKLCERCTYQYGLWRSHCPGCGLHNKQRDEAIAAPVVPPSKRTRRAIAERVRAKAKTGCVFCETPGAKHICPHCDEPIHRNCRGQHEDACKQFQIERRAAEQQLDGGHHAAELR